MQGLTLLLALYVLYLGTMRFLSLHLNRKTAFLWKRHVLLGLAVLITWIGGLGGGLILSRFYWGSFLVTGLHGRAALMLLPLLLFGLGSGLYMNRAKKKRTWLPLIHAINNVSIIVLVVFQIYTGVIIYQTYVLGV